MPLLGLLAVVTIGLETLLPRHLIEVLKVKEMVWRQRLLMALWFLLHALFDEGRAAYGLDATECVHQAVDFAEALWRVSEVLLILACLHWALVDLVVVVLYLGLGVHCQLVVMFGGFSLLIINISQLAPFKLGFITLPFLSIWQFEFNSAD